MIPFVGEYFYRLGTLPPFVALVEWTGVHVFGYTMH